jgi:hypothetical protein
MLSGAALVYMILLGGSEAGVFLLPFQLVDALICSAFVAWLLICVRRGVDRVDLLVVAGLLAFLVSCAAALHPRQAYDAAMTGLGWAAAFGVARRVLADPKSRVLAVRLLTICHLILALIFALVWGRIWIDWVQLTGTAPPVDLQLPAHIYRHYYVVAMLLTALTPASIQSLGDRAIRIPAGCAIALSLPLVVLSGSRLVWLAILIGATAAMLMLRPPSRRVAVGVGVPAIAFVVLAIPTGLFQDLLQRLVSVGTLSYRIDIWREALGLWAGRPLVGVGPGSVSIGLVQTPLMSTYEFVNRHADNAFIQLAAEGGLIALIGAGLVLVAVLVGSRNSLAYRRMALIGLLLLLAMCLGNNPTDSPNLVVVGIVYAAIAAPFTGQAEATKASRNTRLAVDVALWTSAAVLAASAASVFMAAIAQSSARSALSDGRLTTAVQDMAIAGRLDPSMALYHRDLGVMQMSSDPGAALSELGLAAQLNPADAAVARAMAMLRSQLGDQDGAIHEATRATRLRPLEPENWLTLALVADGDTRDSAVVQALHLAPWLTGSPVWPNELSAADSIEKMVSDPTPDARLDSRDPIDPAWLAALGIEVPSQGTAGDRVLDSVLDCRLEDARTTLHELGGRWTESTASMGATAMLARLTGEPDSNFTVRVVALRRPDIGAASRGAVSPYSVFADLAADPQLYRRLGVGPSVGGPLIPRRLDGLASWLSDPIAAARRSQSGVDFAGCVN